MSNRIMGYNVQIKPSCDNVCQIDYGYMCIGTDCLMKSAFLTDFIYNCLQNFALAIKP